MRLMLQSVRGWLARPGSINEVVVVQCTDRDMRFRGNDPAGKRAVAVFLNKNAGVPYCDDCIRSVVRI